jgi:threonine-phosphate decarboxylase
MTSEHGGRLHQAARLWGVTPEDITDFSANINPLGPPDGSRSAIQVALSTVHLRSYPDEYEFVDSVASKLGVSTEGVVVASGSAALLFATLRALSPRRVLLFDPGFSEYARACKALGAQMTRWSLIADEGFLPDFEKLSSIVRSGTFDLVILNSPHNPSGAFWPKANLLGFIQQANLNNIAVLLDEAFVDYIPEASLVATASEFNLLVVLRSLTKFYAMPGLRVGYAVCNANLAARIRRQIESWPVSAVALAAGRAALAEREYESRSRLVNAKSRAEFASAMSDIGLTVFPSAANFLLVRLPRGSAADLARHLEPDRILVRRCGSFVGLSDEYLRLAVLSSRDNLRLVSSIEAWLKASPLISWSE